MKVKVLYIISGVDKAPSFEWIAEFFSNSSLVDIHFCFLSPFLPGTASVITNKFGSSSFIRLYGKQHWPKVFLSLLRLINVFKPDVVHCHLQAASILGLLASFLCGIRCRVYTRHHGSFHHLYHKKGLCWDYFCNMLATKIVSISPTTTAILTEWEGVPSHKIVSIPHGFPLDAFCVSSSQDTNSFAAIHGIPSGKRIVGVVSRFVNWKGVEYTIRAFKSINEIHHNSHLLLLNASGPYSNVISQELSFLPSSSWTAIPFTSDICSAYKLMDVFVHVPIDRLKLEPNEGGQHKLNY